MSSSNEESKASTRNLGSKRPEMTRVASTSMEPSPVHSRHHRSVTREQWDRVRAGHPKNS
jgi:hypothetical protein